MMEILFRGKRIDNGEWVEGYYTKAKDCISEKEVHVIFHTDLTLFPHSEFSSYEEVIPETIGQYTGLMDKNGRRIFEGDIVDHYYQKGFFNRGVVIWDSQNARFAHELRSMSPAFSLYHPEAWEIIGNIHENPELLKEA